MIPARPILLTLALSLLLPWPAVAGFEEALQSYVVGDRTTAFRGFKEAAEAGDIRAFGKLGGMYLYGAGTEKDYGQAYVWFGLAGMTSDQYAESFNAAATRLKREDLPRLDSVIEEKAYQLGLTEPEPAASPDEIPTLGEIIKKRGGVFGTELPTPEGASLPTLDSQ
jgi:TPR repeat protein